MGEQKGKKNMIAQHQDQQQPHLLSGRPTGRYWRQTDRALELPGEVVGSPSLGISKSLLDMVLGNLL